MSGLVRMKLAWSRANARSVASESPSRALILHPDGPSAAAARAWSCANAFVGEM